MDTAETLADLYLRLSDLRLEEQLDGREARLRATAADYGWTVYRVIIENDMVPANGDGTRRPASAFKRRKIRTPSGRTELRTVRPGFRSMLDDLTTGPVRAILAEDLDRLLRQPRDGEDLLDAVELAGATRRKPVRLADPHRKVAPTPSGSPRGSWPPPRTRPRADTARRVRDKKSSCAGSPGRAAAAHSGTATTRTRRSTTSG